MEYYDQTQTAVESLDNCCQYSHSSVLPEKLE